jgi:hypothetical protein
MWKHNLIALVATVVAILVLTYLGNALDPFRRMDMSSELSIAIVAVVFVVIGVGAFLGFSGGFWTRTVLATMAPAVALLLVELVSVISGALDGGYRGLTIVVAPLVAAVSFLGCVFVGGPIFLWRERHLTTQSRSDAR